jgi:hypothetical protein
VVVEQLVERIGHQLLTEMAQKERQAAGSIGEDPDDG